MSKISELSDGGSIQSGDTLIAVRSGGNVKVTYGGTTTANIDGGTIDGTVIGGSSAAAGSFTTITASGEITANGGVALPDNQKATFGASDDLQIYHDSNNSFIKDVGTGDLYIAADNLRLTNAAATEFYAKGVTNGAFSLYYDGSEKLATTTTGINVTGTVTADGLTVDGLARIQGTAVGLVINETDTTDLNSYLSVNGGVLRLFTVNDAFNSFANRVNVDNSTGDISFYEDTGTTAKFFWDASAESLGLGITNPSYTIDSYGSAVRTGGIGTAGVDTRLIAMSAGNGGSGRGVAISFQPSGSANSVEAAKIIALQESVSTTANNAKLTFNVADTSGTLQERMRIDSSGNVSYPWASSGTYKFGIRQAPTNTFATNTSILEIHGADAISGGQAMGGGDVKIRGGLSLGDAAGAAGDVIIEGGGYVAASGIIPGVIKFNTGSTPSERMRIDSSGNLLVGKTASSPTAVGVEARSTGILTAVTSSSVPCAILNRNDNDGDILEFKRSNTTVGSISVTASATAYNTSSDKRLKDNIVDAPSSSDDIDAIQVRSFDWKADGSHQKYGMIAQELMTVAPEAVSGDPESDEMMGVDYSKLVPMLVKEIQSLRARVAQLETN